jgi:uncharacterized membrane protein (DUF2068 family)
MRMSRTTGLEAVIYYKLFIAGLLAATAIALLSTASNPGHLDSIADSGLFESHLWLIDQGLDQFLTWDQTTMQIGGAITGLYATLILVQAIGLWCHRVWAKGLALLTAGMSLPVELYELGCGFTWLKLLLLVVNLFIFGFFWHHLKIHYYWQHYWQRRRERSQK